MNNQDKLLTRAALVTAVVWLAIFCSTLPVFRSLVTGRPEGPLQTPRITVHRLESFRDIHQARPLSAGAQARAMPATRLHASSFQQDALLP